MPRRIPKVPSIPEPFRTISANSSAVPTLTLSGEWLKAAGFPVGAHAYLTTDRRGELALHRLGLGFPRRLYVRATRK